MAELFVFSSGNLGGLTFFEGNEVPMRTRLSCFLPWKFRPEITSCFISSRQGPRAEIDELKNKSESTAKGSSPAAWDFWARDTGNLSEDNDVLSLYDNPEGRLLDGVLYTTKVYEPGMKYNGFGTSLMLNKVKELVAGDGWKTASSEPYPADGFNSDKATATRSICRSSASKDTDAAADWHIVPTKKSSFGAVNTDETYVP